MTATTRRAGDLIVDVHAHYVSHGLLEVDRRFRTVPDETWGAVLHHGDRALGPLIPRLTERARILADMEQKGIGVRLLANASWLTCYWAEPSLGHDIARAVNEVLAREADEDSGRLVGLAAVPLQDVERAVEELEHAVRRLGLRGVAVGTNVNGHYLDEPIYEPFLAAVERLGVPMFLHPDAVAGAERLREYYLTRLIGNPQEVTVALGRMVLGGVLERFPQLKLCFPLGGGSVPFLLGRIEHGWQERAEARARAQLSPREAVQRCHFDTIVHSPDSLRFLLSVVPAAQLMLGSDYPWDMGEEDPVGRVLDADGLTSGDRARILGGTAARLLGLDRATADMQATPS